MIHLDVVAHSRLKCTIYISCWFFFSFYAKVSLLGTCEASGRWLKSWTSQSATCTFRDALDYDLARVFRKSLRLESGVRSTKPRTFFLVVAPVGPQKLGKNLVDSEWNTRRIAVSLASIRFITFWLPLPPRCRRYDKGRARGFAPLHFCCNGGRWSMG